MTQVTDAQLVALAERLGLRARGTKGWVVPPGSVHSGDWEPISWLLTGDGMLAIQSAMAGLGYEGTLRWWIAGEETLYDADFSAYISNRWNEGKGSAATAPDAIVLAACAALGVTG